MIWIKKGSLLAIGLLSLHLPLPAQTSFVDLESLLSLVDQHSKEIALAELKVQSSATSVQQAQINRLPSLQIFGAIDKASNMPIYENGVFQSPTQHEVVHTLYSTGANFYLNVFEGFKTKNEYHLAQILSEISLVEKHQKAGFIRLRATHLFIDLYLQHQWKIAMENDISEKQHELIEIQHIYQAGVVLESDVLRAELELSKRRMTLIEIENSLQVIQQQLNVLIGNPDDTPMHPKITNPLDEENTITLQESLTEALEDGYDMDLSHLHTQLAESRVRINQANFFPKIGLTGSFQFSNPQIFLYPYNLNWYNLGIVGLKASYSISSIYHNKKQVEKSKIEFSEEKLHHEQVNDQVRTRVYKAYFAYDESIKNQKVSEQNLAYADENARILKNAYFSQTALITDLLDANLLQIKAKFEVEQARMNTLKNLYTLKFETGQL